MSLLILTIVFSNSKDQVRLYQIIKLQQVILVIYLNLELPTFVSQSYQKKSELAKYFYLRRLENINLESILENKRNHFEEAIRNYKKELHKLYSELGNYKKKFEDLETDLDYLKNYSNNPDYTNILNVASINSKNREEDLDSLLKIKKILDVSKSFMVSKSYLSI
jgi:hypothetical protein